jgi:hypothetical protein
VACDRDRARKSFVRGVAGKRVAIVTYYSIKSVPQITAGQRVTISLDRQPKVVEQPLTVKQRWNPDRCRSPHAIRPMFSVF